MKAILWSALLIVLIAGGLLLAGSLQSGSSQSITSAVALGEVSPSISSVTPITATTQQTITIVGTYFGNVQPQLLSLGDGSVDTVGGGDTPVIRIYDLGQPPNSWEAGVQDSPGSGADSIGVILKAWSNDKIVLGGFGSALGSGGLNNQTQWSIAAEDPLLIAVLTIYGQAVYTITVGPNAPSIVADPTAITYVSPIAAARNQTIIIDGNGFGNIQPQVTNMSDGSIDTVVGGTTPVIRIYDEEGFDSWEAGCQEAISSGPIGIDLVNWSDHQLVLGGFGSDLSVNGTGPWNIDPGDPLIVDVLTANGQAAYTLTVNSNAANLSYPSSLKPTLAVSCQSSTTLSNFMVEINGSLTYNGTGVPEAPILLAYSVTGGGSWLNLTTIETDSNGCFLAEWLPAVTGYYVINAAYAGNAVFSGTSTIVNFVVTPYNSTGAQDAFSVASNSTVTDLAFNSTSGQLSFTVSGLNGTRGYADVYIAKSLVNDTSNIKAYIDGNAESFTVSSNADSWILTFSYHLCTHQIIIDLSSSPKNAIDPTEVIEGIALGATVSLAMIATLFQFFRKNKNLRQ
ncbi:MAG: hypothetical protein ABSF65_09010 [Candidatus Bathyarchaeia archaeon]|jgi:hypothetical protein